MRKTISASRAAMVKARKRIMLIGWDFDARIELIRGDHAIGADDAPAAIGDLLYWLVERNPDLQVCLLRSDLGTLKSLFRDKTILTVAKSAMHPRKWIGRYAAEGPAGLAERTSAPVTQAAQTPPKIVAAILKLRRKYLAWGPRKLRARLRLDDSTTVWPAASTIGDILKRAGLVRPRKLRRRVPAGQHPFRGADAPNDVWCIDFKGFWKTGDGVRVLPFTVTDAMSRYLLVCQAVEHPDFETVWSILTKAFKEYGLPRAIRSDNGPPFGAVAAGGLSRPAANFVRMGITPERITPGKPQENGRHERMHQTLKREAATPPSLTHKAQLVRLERFRQICNDERPHEALGQIPPARVFTPSPRLWDGKLRSPAYWGATHVRTVRVSGLIKWRGRELFVSEVLNGQRIGIFEIADDEYEVRFGPILLGYIKGKHKLIRVRPGKRRRHSPENCHPAARSETSPM